MRNLPDTATHTFSNCFTLTSCVKIIWNENIWISKQRTKLSILKVIKSEIILF